jgi:signal transduction histidine kinase/CheY-like chemotaxis protein
MKKSLFLASIATVLLVFVNVYLASDLYKEQVNFQKNILTKQAEVSITDIESELHRFESDLNFVLFSDDISELFSDRFQNSNPLRKLELFYSSYSNLIKNVDIYDNNKNVLNLFKDKKTNYITDRYLAQRQRKLAEQEEIRVHDSEYQYLVPVFKDKVVYGNIVISFDLSKYIISELSKYHLSEIYFQSLIDPETKSISSNLNRSNITMEGMSQIVQNLKEDRGDLIVHAINSDSLKIKSTTVYLPLNIINHKFGIAFSVNNNYFINRVFTRLSTIWVISFILFVLSLAFLLMQLRLKEKSTKSTKIENIRLTQILEHLPLGVIIFDSTSKIHYINEVARKILQLKADEVHTGNTITQKFLLSGHTTRTEGKASAYDVDQFVLYQKEGNEVVLYKKEYTFLEGDLELTFSAFIDITHIEKARKYEAAANTAKSEFLAKMSHEIRTPMNGIIGMTDALNRENLTREQLEYVDIVKRSADLLLSLIDDILDYSKIEAGKMQLEEIPFKLSEEAKLSLDLFRSIIDEKGIKLKLEISPEITDDIIGDPFRLRQVLSNLISNAVKFTHEGEIRLSIKLEEQYNGNLSLLFEIADTGVGIPKERLESIFNSFTQADHSTSRKYGGTGLGTTISKQLVNLMNGEIWVESPSGISKNKKYPGSKFSFTIEVFSNKDLEKDLDFSGINSFSQVNALIITQNPATKKRLLDYLKHLDIETDVVNFSEEIISSIQKYLQNGKAYPLIIIIDEPNFDGLWITRQLDHSGINNKHRILMISSHHKQENYIQTKMSKVDYYITEPFEQDILKNYLHRCFPAINENQKPTIMTLQEDLNILVAEDNIINQKVAESIFRSLNYKIDIALDGKEVVDMIKKKNYDIVFMDLQMPVKDGVDATVEIRGLGFQMPIIAMTATASKIAKDNALTSGMNDYITKPIKVDSIRSVLEKWFV